MRPSALLLLVAALAVTWVTPGHSHSVSSRRGQGRRLTGAGTAATQEEVGLPQCQLVCLQRGDCASFNYNSVTRTCEVFTVTVCDHYSYYLVEEDGWSWYDVIADTSQESANWLWGDAACVDAGRCRDERCLRRLGDSCREHGQCRYHVTGAASCVSNKCACDSSHWQYNTTLCEPRSQELRTDGGHWVWKKIVNNCYLEFEAHATQDLRFVLAESNTHYSNRYHFRIGYDGNTRSNAEWIRQGVNSATFATFEGDILDVNGYRRFHVHWCSGQIRFSRPGVDTYISWDDPGPFSPAYIGIWTTLEGKWKFDKDLVDPWMEKWSKDRIYELPKSSVIFRRKEEEDQFSVEFDCAASRDCEMIFSNTVLWDGSNMYQVIIGGSSNTRSAIKRHKPSVGWNNLVLLSTPGIVSRSELRSFRITFAGNGRIQAFKAGEATPFMEGQDPSPVPILFYGPRNCCDNTNMALRLGEEFWYENGYRWNEGLG